MSTEVVANERASQGLPSFSSLQRRVLVTSIIGYALYYFLRKNLSIAMPVLDSQLGIGKSELGLFLTAHGLLYGVSKFANGIIGDRVNARWFLVAGLVICAGLNILFGFTTSALAMGFLWAANGWFQGMGFPPCARLMSHWFSPKELATKWSIWNSSHSIGAGIIVILCGYLVPIDWRLAFFVPAGIALVGAALLAMTMCDTPESLGLPPVEGTEALSTQAPEPISETLVERVFSNPYIWLFALANFFVYSVRYGLFDWGPTYLKQARGIDLSSAGWIVAAYEGAGIVGTLVSGWITDRWFGGRGGRTCVVYMIGCVAALTALWLVPFKSPAAIAAVLAAAGFFIYGPQALVGISVANLATKRAAAAAVGLTGLFGYASAVLSGYGVGWLAEHHGWDAGFLLLEICGVLGLILFALCWGAKAHGYGDVEAPPR
jgi:OPA family glycerol-3-phosphate transporter-like MFS transporter/OPA family sugar phosphate sensor protein UhpC-like MFS transporter